MNKKILSIFVMIMALSLFGVSCSNEESTGTGGNNNQKKNLGTLAVATQNLTFATTSSGSAGTAVDEDDIAVTGWASEIAGLSPAATDIDYTVKSLVVVDGAETTAAETNSITKDIFTIGAATSASYDKFKLSVSADNVKTVANEMTTGTKATCTLKITATPKTGADNKLKDYGSKEIDITVVITADVQ